MSGIRPYRTKDAAGFKADGANRAIVSSIESVRLDVVVAIANPYFRDIR
jgi:hypothetical protein